MASARKRKRPEKMFKKIKKTKFYPIALLTVVVLVSVSLLMGMNAVTSSVIESRRKAEIVKQLEIIFPSMTDFVIKDDIYRIQEGAREIGYAFIAAGEGYGGEISIMVGLDDEMLIKGVSVLSQEETPGLGAKITEEEFTSQFKGLRGQDLMLSSSGGQIDAVSGATVSSEAMVNAIREAMEEKIKVIK